MAWSGIIPAAVLVRHRKTGRRNDHGQWEAMCGRWLGEPAFTGSAVRCPDCDRKPEGGQA